MRVPVTWPLSALKVPCVEVSWLIVVFLASLGILPPPLTHEYCVLAVALHCMLTCSLSPKPASLKLHTRLFPWRAAEAWVKCGFAARAGVIAEAESPAAAIAIIAMVVYIERLFFINPFTHTCCI